MKAVWDFKTSAQGKLLLVKFIAVCPVALCSDESNLKLILIITWLSNILVLN